MGQRAEFGRSGLLRLAGAVPLDAVEGMRDRLWGFLAERDGIERDRPETWPGQPPRRLQPLWRSGAFAAMGSERVRRALDDLLPEGWREPKAWGLPLVTFPAGGRWSVPATGWHVDSFGPDHEVPGVTVFVFLGTVVAGGGGTAVIPGSHHLVNRHIATTGEWRPAAVKAALAAEHGWLRDLWGRPARSEPEQAGEQRGDSGPVGVGGAGEGSGDGVGGSSESSGDGVGGRVVELTGEPGDVVLMHSRTLHAPAPNTAARPRVMLVEIVNR